MLKKDDISIDWSSWSVVGSIALSKLWLEYGLSSSQIRTNDVRNVVLLVVDPSSIHHYIFWSDQCYHRVHMMVEVQWYGNSDELLLSPSVAFCLPPWIMLNINLVLETFESIFFMLAHEVLVWWKEWLPLIHVHFDVSCRREFEKACFYLLWNRPKSVMHVRRILWSVRLIIFIPYVYPSTPSHWLSCSKIKESVQGELFGLPRVETSMSLMMVPPPELGSVLL